MNEQRFVAATLASGILAGFQRSTMDTNAAAVDAVSLYQAILRELEKDSGKTR